jgi:hypothetical protein
MSVFSCKECSLFKFNQIQPRCAELKGFFRQQEFNVFCLRGDHENSVFQGCPKSQKSSELPKQAAA